jgi:hypothetical protein
LRNTLIHVGMCLELEEQVETINQQQDDTRATTDGQHRGLRSIGLFFFERSVESRLYENGQYNIFDNDQDNGLPEARDS